MQEYPMSPVSVGSPVPDFSLPDQHGNMFHLSSLVGKKNVVIYFYPKDSTPGCTREACGFQARHTLFEEHDAVVVGISADDAKSHEAFAERFGLTFPLLSDRDHRVRKLFGVSTGIFGIAAGRETFVVNKRGILVHRFNSMLQAERHIHEALGALASANRPGQE
jgi:thioredoxin-dependent peroxiredoxin